MKKYFLVGILFFSVLISGCAKEAPQGQTPALTGEIPEQPPVETAHKEPPQPLPKGILANEIPSNADILFSSIRHVLNDLACLDENYELKGNFINDPDCNRKIYRPEGGLASPKQLFVLDIETGKATQLTNMDCIFTSGQAVDSTTLMANAICADTNANGMIDDGDRPDIYLLDLSTENMDCLTCELGVESINNPDYSSKNGKIVFSARLGPDLRHSNYLFTVDLDKNLVQLTNGSGYMDFDCSWSADAGKIVFSRLPLPAFGKPSEVWIADADGKNLVQITEGGPNPNNEENFNPFPIGIDADPHLSPDNKEIVFSRLKTGKENVPFGIFELVAINTENRQETILDSKYANMVPEWKSKGIFFLRQEGATDPMKVKQALYRYYDGNFEELEKYPYNVFPLGAFSCSWIEEMQ